MNTFLQQFIEGLKSDPIYRKKVLFIVGASILVIFLISVIILFNQDRSDNQAGQQPSVSTIQPEVTQGGFDTISQLQPVNSTELSSAGVFLASEDETIITSKDYTLSVNNELIPDKTFLPRTIYTVGETTIVNEDGKTTYISNNEAQESPNGALWVTPVLLPNGVGLRSNPGFMFFVPDDQGYVLTTSSNIDLSDAQGLVRVSPQEIFSLLELRVINNIPYFILYEGISRQGTIEIWEIATNSSFNKVQVLEDVNSIAFGPRGVLYTSVLNTPNDITKYKNTLINFASSSEGVSQEIAISSEAILQSVYGSVIAERCALSRDNTVYCVVKNGKVNFRDFRFSDSLLKFNTNESTLEFPLDGAQFAAREVYISPDNELYIVSQEQPLLFKVNI